MRFWPVLLIASLFAGDSFGSMVKLTMRNGTKLQGDLVRVQDGIKPEFLFRVKGGKMKYNVESITKTLKGIKRMGPGKYKIVYKTGKELEARMDPVNAKLVLNIKKEDSSILMKDLYSLEVLALEPGTYIAVENTPLRPEPNGTPFGTLNKGATFKKLEDKGEWTKIQIEGWVWTPATQE